MARLFVCGDIVNMGKTNSFIGEKLSAIIADSDYVIGNLEGPELPSPQSASFPHQFSGTVEYLKNVGFNMMLLANNHITEMGAEGLEYTLRTIDGLGVDRIGAGMSWDDAYKPLVKEIAGMSFGFMNVCEAQKGFYSNPGKDFGFAWMGYSRLLDDINSLARDVEHVIVFVHTGLEHYSIPLPEVRDFYHQLCEAGASAVIGGHTHSAQGYEYYGNKFIAYSLGNFYFPRIDGSWEKENESYSLTLDFHLDNTIDVSPICHKLCDGQVELNNKDEAVEGVDLLCKQLSENYLENADKMCIDAFINKYSKILAMATCGEPEKASITDILKNVLKTTLLRKKHITSTRLFRNNQLLTCFQNETRRATIIRALSNRILNQ